MKPSGSLAVVGLAGELNDPVRRDKAEALPPPPPALRRPDPARVRRGRLPPRVSSWLTASPAGPAPTTRTSARSRSARRAAIRLSRSTLTAGWERSWPKRSVTNAPSFAIASRASSQRSIASQTSRRTSSACGFALETVVLDQPRVELAPAVGHVPWRPDHHRLTLRSAAGGFSFRSGSLASTVGSEGVIAAPPVS